MNPCYVGFDTSNYTTSCAVCDSDGRVVVNLKTPLRVKEGQRGLRQSDAVFEHVKNIPDLMKMLSEELEKRNMTPIAVGVSTQPRDAENSYMPCFLSGKSAAYSFAACRGLAVHELSHQNGHIMAALYSADKLDLLKAERFLAFHVSGGTTEALLVSSKADGFSVEIVGNTSDINAGQAIDRVGVKMGLAFPCGAELERLAIAFDGRIYQHAVCVRDGVCSLSGVENIAEKIYKESGSKQAAAAFVFDFIGRTLEKMCDDIMLRHGDMPVVFAGGVMSNKIMRKRLSDRFDAYFSEPRFSSDNAAGIALLCRNKEINR